MPEHAEVNPSAGLPLISPLVCPLVETIGEMFLEEGSLIRKAYGESPILEGFHCSYGLNRDYSSLVLGNELRRLTAHDADGEVRAVELMGHRFFVGTLFQPERKALLGDVPPLVRAFVASLRLRLFWQPSGNLPVTREMFLV